MSADLAAEFTPIACIETFSDGSFQLAEEGRLAKLMGVYALGDDLLDLVAWEFSDPSRWWLRRGAVAYLGEAALRAAWWRKEPVFLVPTPQDWLDVRGQAVCLLDWSADPRDILDPVHAITCSSRGLERRLRDTIAARCRWPINIKSAA